MIAARISEVSCVVAFNDVGARVCALLDRLDGKEERGRGGERGREREREKEFIYSMLN